MILQLIIKLITGEAGIYMARLKRLAVLYAIMGLFAIAMLASLISALSIFLANRYGALETALGFAGVSFLLLIATGVAVVIARRPPRKRADDRLQRDIAAIAGVTALSSAPQVFGLVKKRKGLLLVPVAAAGAWGIWRAISSYRTRGDRWY
ncbi:MAG TPA: hypothetical protein ENH55_22860 [Aurantimonas coralicida]|uniref:Phage holin family protein n=2 Tax=root TaxID=1 RepID=A0A9C9TFB2_9HYPH|nr:hypothetical protein [Aurantimonas coralicida]HET99011.1 hypothetical protein [Aurantimonas coralicida]